MKKFWKKPWISCLLALFLFAAGCSGQASARPKEPERETASDQADDPAKGWNSTPRVLVPEAPGTVLMGNSSIEIDVSNISK